MGFLTGRVWFPLWSNVMTLATNRVNDRDREQGRKGKDLERAASFGRKGHVRRIYSVQYVGSLRNNWYVDVGFRNLFYLTDPRNTDRLTKESLRKKKRSDIRNSLHVQRLGWVYESQGLVCYLEHRQFDDPGSEDLINEEWFRTSGTRRARGMPEDGAGIRTRLIKC